MLTLAIFVCDLWKNHNKLPCLYIGKRNIQTEFLKITKCINTEFVYIYPICTFANEIYKPQPQFVNTCHVCVSASEIYKPQPP